MIRKKDIHVHAEQYESAPHEHIIRASMSMTTTMRFSADVDLPSLSLSVAKQQAAQDILCYVYDDVLMKTHDVFQRLMDKIYKLNSDGDYRRMEAVDLAHSELANYIRDTLDEKE